MDSSGIFAYINTVCLFHDFYFFLKHLLQLTEKVVLEIMSYDLSWALRMGTQEKL